jgi:hypothetical protein
MTLASPITLLHPSGIVRLGIVVGEGCPPGLSALLHDAAGDQPADLIVVAPEANESEAAAVLRERLTPEGVAYVILSRRRRRRLARRAGLELTTAMLHIGDRAEPRFLVPAQRETVRWALRSLTPSKRAAAARFVPFLLDRVAPAAVLRRPRAHPVAGWLNPGGAEVVLGRSTALLVRDGALVEVAKVGVRAPAERAALERLGPGARAAGAAVPEPLREAQLTVPVLIETGIAGRPAATILWLRPRELESLVMRLTDWLLRWNTATAVEARLTRDLLESELLSPARALDAPRDYVSWLERRCAAAEGVAIKLVATHNDLTTANIIVGESTPLGVVDWEAGKPDGLPLTDLFYAVADAHAASDRFRDRLGAFRAALTTTNKHERRIADALGLEPLVAELCFHACWLGHAANEASRQEPKRSFAEIVRLIANERIRMDE